MVSQPKSPDPYDTASAQQNANVGSSVASSIVNNPNQSNVYGNLNYSLAGYETVKDANGKDIQVPRYNRTETLSPEQMQLYQKQNQMQQNLGQLGVDQSAKLQGLLGTNLTTEGLEGWNRGTMPTTYTPEMFSAERDKTQQALLDRYYAQANPQREQQEAKLAARGMSPGSQQWGAVQDSQNRQDVDAANQAFLAGGQEQSRMFGLQQASDSAANNYAAFLNNLRQGQLQERQAVRNAPINEISALMSGSQVTVPQYQSFSQQGVESTPIGSYIMQDYQNRANQAANTNAGLFGLGSGLVSLATAPVTGGGSLFGNWFGR